MMSLSTIRQMSRDAALRARRENKQPFVIEECDIADLRDGKAGRLHLPFIGDLVPKGWKRFDLAAYEYRKGWYPDEHGKGSFFVDTSGYGLDGEPALSRKQMFETLATIAEQNGYRVGWALTEAGQFQGHISAFVKKES